ncbi:MAG: SurA N-terminal domain-containing protein [Thermoleophilaceae bacterium]
MARGDESKTATTDGQREPGAGRSASTALRRSSGMPARLALGAVLALVLVAIGCSGDDGDGGSSGDVPEGAVATVDGEEISRERLDDQVEALQRAQRGGPSKLDRKQVEQQALATLLQTEWLEQEADERGIEVDMAEVRARWRSAARDQFKTKKALRRFLGGQTEADVLRQLRLQTLTEKIHEDIRANADGNPDRAVKRFQRELQQRASESTACREGYDAPGCGGSD